MSIEHASMYFISNAHNNIVKNKSGWGWRENYRNTAREKNVSSRNKSNKLIFFFFFFFNVLRIFSFFSRFVLRSV